MQTEAVKIREFASYDDMAATHQREIDRFPMCFLFGPKTAEQTKKELEEALGCSNLSELMRIPAGGIIRKADKDKLLSLFKLHEEERLHFWSNFDHLVEAITREMYNHEYADTRDEEDTLSALGRTAEDLKKDEFFAKAFKKAQKKVLGKEAAV